jgi:hypothetical protein
MVLAAFVVSAGVALSSYAAVLWMARSDWQTELRPYQSVQKLGSQASAFRNATLEPLTGSIAMTKNASALWKVSTSSLSAHAPRSIVIVSGEPLLVDRFGAATIALGGTSRPLKLASDAYGPVKIPPWPDRGYRIEIPAGNACLRETCKIELRVHHGYWRIYRVAVVTEQAISSVGEYR